MYRPLPKRALRPCLDTAATAALRLLLDLSAAPAASAALRLFLGKARARLVVAATTAATPARTPRMAVLEASTYTTGPGAIDACLPMGPTMGPWLPIMDPWLPIMDPCPIMGPCHPMGTLPWVPRVIWVLWVPWAALRLLPRRTIALARPHTAGRA